MEQEKQSRGMIRLCDPVKVTKIRDEYEVKSLRIANRAPSTRPHGKGQHINTRTSEITQDKPRTTTRGENMQSFRASQNELRNLIKANTVEHDKILLLTLTYENAVPDTAKLKTDFEKFIDKLRTRYTAEFGQILYVNIYEPDPTRNGLHIHAILFFHYSKKSVFMPSHEIEKLWGRGYIKLTRPFGNEEIYGYLTPAPARIVTAENRHMHEKALRLMAMPSNQPMYRASRNLKRPIIYTDNYENVKKYLVENGYTFRGEQIYPSGMKTLKGNIIYNAKEHYIAKRSNTSGAKCYAKPRETTSKARRKRV
jgi:hypothetical protein